MGVTPVNLTRISQNLRAFNLLNTVRSTGADLFRTQNQLATGLRFQAPSDDPARAVDAIKLDRYLEILDQVDRNLLRVNETLRIGETSMQEAGDLVLDAHTLALSMISDQQSEGERQSIQVVVDSLLDQLITVGNRKYLDSFLFSGHYGDDTPFELVDGGVIFRGDNGRLATIVDSDQSTDTFTISGMEFFNAVSSAVQGYVDLNPAVTRDTRLSDLNGATGAGVTKGRILVATGAQNFEIDLSQADTVGDAVDRLNAELPDSLIAVLGPTGINILSVGQGLNTLTITDTGGANTATELGIARETPGGSIFGASLDPRLTPRTALKDLDGGGGLDLNDGITIRNGSEVATVSFTGTQTIEDVLNRINESGAGVLARIAADGRTIEVLNRISGSELTIEESGGQTAALLGIRSMNPNTMLANLNDGIGVDTVEGDDFRITTADGTTIDVDLDDLDLNNATLQDLVDLLNLRGGGAITAGFAVTGNGLTIRDNTAGGGTLAIERLNLSAAIDGLGLNAASVGGVITGTDVNPIKVDSPFTALLELKEALGGDDSRGISAAGERLERTMSRMQEIQGKLAANAATMLERVDRISNERSATQILQSDIRDADMTEAIVRFQQVQTALQANLATASRVMSLNLFDYLR